MAEKAAEAGKEGIFSRGQTYFKDSVDELKKVHTPTRQEALRLTWVVLLIIVFISLCLFLVDLSFNWFMTRVMEG
jgi:preprotein translocase subunit SecE